MNNRFTWTDLSTFNMRHAKRFYSKCFGWEYYKLADGYISCQVQEQPAAGLFTLPDKFQSIGMPSFWMSYIQVDSVEETVRIAEQYDAKVEIKPQPAPGGGVFALIRDPAGAGFTCFEGEDPGGKNHSGNPGHMVWNELHVSDPAKVESFYTNVFGWRIESTDTRDRYHLFASSPGADPVAGIRVTANDIKGDKEYWGVYFSVSSLAIAAENIEQGGGHVAVEQPLGSCLAILAYDPQGAAFYIVEGSYSTF